jgi:hypothetical protein
MYHQIALVEKNLRHDGSTVVYSRTMGVRVCTYRCSQCCQPPTHCCYHQQVLHRPGNLQQVQQVLHRPGNLQQVQQVQRLTRVTNVCERVCTYRCSQCCQPPTHCCYHQQVLHRPGNLQQVQQVSTGVNRCQQVSTGVNRCNRCQQVSTGVNRCQQVSTGVNRCQQVRTVALYATVSTGCCVDVIFLAF